MLCTVSTVKDNLANVQRFVRGNLAGGADHLFVFLDAPSGSGQVEVAEWLAAQPEVTCVVTDAAWWLGDRPSRLNVRQRTNANLVKHLLAPLDWAQWLFHIDGDEQVLIDRDVLDQVPDECPAARLTTLEAVSRLHWEGDPTWWKRLLDDGELDLLHTLELIERPKNSIYFHGHIEGKSGVRPRADVWLTLHKPVDGEREVVAAYEHPALRMLHYESYSGEDFVRKWTAMVASGPTAGQRPGRGVTMLGLKELLDKELTPAQAEPLLMRIYQRTTADDFETLRELGLLVELDPAQGTHRPQPLPDGGREQLDEGIAALRNEPKRQFHVGGAK